MADSILDALKGINSYPIPLRTLTEVAERRGVELMATSTAEVLNDKSYRLAKADLMLWLSYAPNISQGGQSYSFTDEQRKEFRHQAQAVYDALEPSENTVCATFGYKGDKL